MREEVKTYRGGLSPRRRRGLRRRRGSILVFVVALLGILFVMGLAFIASMNFESESIAIETELRRGDTAADLAFEGLSLVLRSSILGGSGEVVGGSALSSTFPRNFAEMPMVHNLASPAEPYVNPDGRLLYHWMTDLESLRAGEFNDSGRHLWEVDTMTYNGYGPTPSEPDLPRWLDADGDGVVDSIQLSASVLGFSDSQQMEISRLVNGPAREGEPVYTGVRIVSHGGMVNLNYSHPTLVDNLLDKEFGFIHKPRLEDPEAHGQYSLLLEEPLLRRRGGGLPPRVMPPTEMFGNPFADPSADPYGGGDMAEQFFAPRPSGVPGPDYYTPFEGDHQYYPFDPYELFPGFADGPTTWAMRMQAETSYRFQSDGNEYDRMHLSSLDTLDDQLARGALYATYDPETGTLMEEEDARDLMVGANRKLELAPEPGFGPTPPFEYPDYPHDLPNVDDCAGSTDPYCELAFLKGRLRLSLPWLQQAMDTGIIDQTQAVRLLQDAFTMMLLNARDRVQFYGYGDFKTVGLPGGATRSYWDYDFDAISLSAASLAANVIDFADADDMPTRVLLRSSDFRDRADGKPDSPEVAGEPFDPPQYIFGLERQPYITEVAVVIDPPTPPSTQGIPAGWAVELFNPYQDAFEMPDHRYHLVFGDSTDPDALRFGTYLPLEEQIWARGYTVFRTVSDGTYRQQLPSPGAGVYELTSAATAGLIAEATTLFLIREVDVPDSAEPAFVVVDQFELPPGFATQWDLAGGQSQLYSVERVAQLSGDPEDPMTWRATVPKSFELAMDVQTLGLDNVSTDDDIRPVEVLFANTDDLATAFPTTGSMLMLMRHGNHGIEDYHAEFYNDWEGFGSGPYVDLAFTSKLMGVRTPKVWDPAQQMLVDAPQGVELYEQIDNGRMPVFDTGLLFHIDPSDQSTCELGHPGEVTSLPWGQLVFDYFTALPLRSEGPYYLPPGVGDFQLDESSGPRVDMDGLRVHGRIDINAAVWKVQAGLPLVPADDLPEVYRPKVRLFAQLDNDGSKATPIEDELAKSIVAYREVRELRAQDGGTTGDYGSTAVDGEGKGLGRDWNMSHVPFRRGSGFMTVGELANVRHRGATIEPPDFPEAGITGYSKYRMDSGVLDWPVAQQDYMAAVSKLVALGDWVSVRSHVFTVYGVLRGEEDATIEVPGDWQLQERLRVEDVNSRAVRFQETVDRLPMFMGERVPARIGERVVARYGDVQSD